MNPARDAPFTYPTMVEAPRPGVRTLDAGRRGLPVGIPVSGLALSMFVRPPTSPLATLRRPVLGPAAASETGAAPAYFAGERGPPRGARPVLGGRGSIPVSDLRCARYGGNTPCVEAPRRGSGPEFDATTVA